MKMQFKSMVILLGVSVFILAGFRNADHPGIKVKQSKNGSRSITIDFLYTSRAADGTVMGTFTAHGAINASGTSEMHITPVPGGTHCSQTLTTRKGTITALTDCKSATMMGVWHIISGTGHYSHLQGNGPLQMVFPGAPIIVIEHWTGKVWGNQGNNDDDDDDDEQN